MNRFVRAEIRQRLRITLGLSGGIVALFLAFGASYESFGGATPQATLFRGKPPAGISAFSGTRTLDVFSPHHFLAFGFNHPLYLVLTLTVAISVATSVAGDIETGRAELLYSRPLPRTRLLVSRASVWLGAQLFVLTVALGGAAAGSRLSPTMRAAGVGKLVYVPVQTLSLVTFVAGAGFLASSLSRTRGVATARTVGVTAVAYLMNFVALVWEPAEWLHHFTPFGYYEPLVTIDRGVQWASWLVLTGTGALLFAVSAFQLRRRDLV